MSSRRVESSIWETGLKPTRSRLPVQEVCDLWTRTQAREQVRVKQRGQVYLEGTVKHIEQRDAVVAGQDWEGEGVKVCLMVRWWLRLLRLEVGSFVFVLLLCSFSEWLFGSRLRIAGVKS
jgi:hypothetical protein